MSADDETREGIHGRRQPGADNDSAVVIPSGQPVTLRVYNADPTSPRSSGASHQFAISELGINVKLQPGQSTVIDLPSLPPATYHYYCSTCCGRGSNPAMQGALIVH